MDETIENVEIFEIKYDDFVVIIDKNEIIAKHNDNEIEDVYIIDNDNLEVFNNYTIDIKDYEYFVKLQKEL